MTSKDHRDPRGACRVARMRYAMTADDPDAPAAALESTVPTGSPILSGLAALDLAVLSD